MAISQTTTAAAQTIQATPRRIIERLSIILVCCGIILSGIFFAFVEAMALYSMSTGFEGTEPHEYITLFIMLAYTINLTSQAVYVIVRTVR